MNLTMACMEWVALARAVEKDRVAQNVLSRKQVEKSMQGKGSEVLENPEMLNRIHQVLTKPTETKVCDREFFEDPCSQRRRSVRRTVALTFHSGHGARHALWGNAQARPARQSVPKTTATTIAALGWTT